MVALGDCTKILLPPESLLDETAEMSDLAEKGGESTSTRRDERGGSQSFLRLRMDIGDMFFELDRDKSSNDPRKSICTWQ